MMIAPFEEKYVTSVVDLWNRTAARDGYKEFTESSFRAVFLGNRNFDFSGAFIQADEDGAVRGFACGVLADDLPYGDCGGFLTCVVSEDENGDGARALLGYVEDFFARHGKKFSEVIFFNPIMLPWYIANTPRHEHNNAPGAPVDSVYSRFLSENGYAVRTTERAMYLALRDFRVTDYIRSKEAACGESGYEVTLFDTARHTSLAETLKVFQNPLWEREILDAARRGIPFLVASRGHVVVGFAGPIVTEPSGRGYFSGIGVHPAHEKQGLGSVLFFKLCEEFQKTDAQYMSLYTGVSNPALHIYERAGFRPARDFYVMRKELIGG